MRTAPGWLLPRSRWGNVALILDAAGSVALVIFFLVISAGVRGGDTYWEQPALAIPITIAGACYVAGGAAVLVALLRRDLAATVWFGLLVGVLVALFVVGEVTNPH